MGMRGIRVRREAARDAVFIVRAPCRVRLSRVKFAARIRGVIDLRRACAPQVAAGQAAS
jgi:hypothetical protein